MLNRRATLAAALAYKGKYQPAHVATATTLSATVTMPGAAQPGDYVILLAGGPYTSYTTPSGLTKHINYTANRPNLDVFGGFLPDPIPASYTVSGTVGLVLSVFRRVDPSTPLDVAIPTVSTTATSPAITTANERSTVVTIFSDYLTNIAYEPYMAAPFINGDNVYLSDDSNYWFALAYRTTVAAGVVTPSAWLSAVDNNTMPVNSPVCATIALRGADIP